MTVYDPELCARLEREAREDDERMTPGTWSQAGRHGEVMSASPGNHRHYETNPVTSIPDYAGNLACIARTRNNLRATADQLEAAQLEISAMRRGYNDLHAMLPGNGDIWTKLDKLLRNMAADRSRSMSIESRAILERDAARAERDRNLEMAHVAADARDVARVRIAELERQVERARPVLEAAVAWAYAFTGTAAFDALETAVNAYLRGDGEEAKKS